MLLQDHVGLNLPHVSSDRLLSMNGTLALILLKVLYLLVIE